MSKLRMRFSKTGRAVYISHLDLMHTMQRAISRCGCSLKYSEGFNPHPQISIALPLSVGQSSVCEIMDFKLIQEIEPDELKNKLNHSLPEGIKADNIYYSDNKASEIKWISVTGSLEFDSGNISLISEDLKNFYAGEHLVISKKTKRGTADFDIKEGFKELQLEPHDGKVKLSAYISAAEPSFNPDLFVEALKQLRPEICPDFAEFMRIELFDKNMNVFR